MATSISPVVKSDAIYNAGTWDNDQHVATKNSVRDKVELIEAEIAAVSSVASGAVANTRTINTSAPLTGGGDLSSDRTIAMPQATALQSGFLASSDFINFNSAYVLASAATPTNTPSTLVSRDAFGAFAASKATLGELGLSSTVVPLNDNQASPSDILTYSAAIKTNLVIYRIERGPNGESGMILIDTDGSTVNKAHWVSPRGLISMDMQVDISAGNVRLRYTSAATGTAPVISFSQFKLS